MGYAVIDQYLNKVTCGDCLELMANLPDGCVDLVVTDPPYGIGKAEWDTKFPTEWYREAKRIASTVCIITGSYNPKDSIPLVGDDFIDVIAARNMNGMTFTKSGFGNWLACVIAGKPIKRGITCFDFVIKGIKMNHPSPKPIDYMLRLINRISEPNNIILDPFAGSGTTLVAAKEYGRQFIGFEISPEYCKIAEERLSQEVLKL